MNDEKRSVELLVLSDIHLGSLGCNAKELVLYLKSIKPKAVVLNGDIIDAWQFQKRHWHKSHTKVMKIFIKWMTREIPIYLIPGNHDEMLRKFVGFEISGLKIQNQFVLELDGKKAWFFHGDVFDVTMKNSKWLAHLGAVGYDLLILINRMMNFFSEMMGKGKISFSKKIKNSVKSAVKHINNFEQTAAEIAIDNKYDFVVCGHIHQPVIREVVNEKGSTIYLNSGDWIENLTALEYNKGNWEIYQFKEEEVPQEEDAVSELEDQSYKEIFLNLTKEFQLI